MTVRERFNTLTSEQLAEELERIQNLKECYSELDNISNMADYLNSEYLNNQYSDYE
jgi:hypothetical protein